MSERNDGGPAFPVADFDHQTFQPKTVGDAKRLLSGMSLRDYFAGQALALGQDDEISMAEVCKYLGIQQSEYDWKTHWPMFLAQKAYAMAGAMLAAREGS